MHSGPVEPRLEERVPPYSKALEMGVLGAVLRDNACLDEVRPLLRGEDFYVEAHRLLYGLILEEIDAGRPAALDLIAQRVKDRGRLEDVGGYAFFAEVYDAGAGVTASAEYSARKVRDLSKQRGLVRAGWDIARSGQNPTGSVDEMIEHAQRLIFSLAERGLALDRDERPVRELVGEVYDLVDARSRGDVERGLPTGLDGLDYLLVGLQPGEVTIVAARPSVGKTTLGMAFCCNAARRRKPTLFVSLETPSVKLTERAMCAIGGVSSQAVRQGSMTDEEKAKFLAAGEVLREAPLVISDGFNQTVARVASRARRMKRREGLELLAVDYLQLVEPEDRRQPRHEQVAGVSRRLKLLARELNVPVVVMAQLNRESEKRSGEKPKMSDLRESGSIEADADVVLLLHRETRDSPDLQVQVAKNRNGPTGDVTLRHHKSTGRVTDPADTPFE